MKVVTQENRVTIDDGSLVVVKNGGAYTIRAEGFASVETNALDEAPLETVEYDPHHYKSGGNGLTVEASAKRALNHIEEMLYDEQEPTLTDSEYEVVEEAVKAIVADEYTEGRHSVYTLAGGILKGMREGDYQGVPFAWLFKGVSEGFITPPVKPEPKNPFREYFGSNVLAPTYYGRGA